MSEPMIYQAEDGLFRVVKVVPVKPSAASPDGLEHRHLITGCGWHSCPSEAATFSSFAEAYKAQHHEMLVQMVKDAYSACRSEAMNCPWCGGYVSCDRDEHQKCCPWLDFKDEYIEHVTNC